MNNFLETLASLSIKRGTIFHSDIFEKIDHGKYFVIIGENEEEYIGFFYINSRIHPSIESKPVLLNLQYLLRKEKYLFLRYDSYLACNNITKISKQKLSDSIIEGVSEIKGEIDSEDMDNILSLVRSSKIFSQKEKETFFK